MEFCIPSRAAHISLLRQKIDTAIVKFIARFKWRQTNDVEQTEYASISWDNFPSDNETANDDTSMEPGEFIKWAERDFNDPKIIASICKHQIPYVPRVIYWMRLGLGILQQVKDLGDKDLKNQPMSLNPVRDKFTYAYIKVYECIKEWDARYCEPAGNPEIARAVSMQRDIMRNRRNLLVHEYGVNTICDLMWEPLLRDVERDWPSCEALLEKYLAALYSCLDDANLKLAEMGAELEDESAETSSVVSENTANGW